MPDNAIDHGVVQRDPLTQLRGGPVLYHGFVDPSGGSGMDSYTCAVSHLDGAVAVLDAVLEMRPPYNTETATAAVAALCKRYRVTREQGDRFGGD